jgi:hypothetical protein
MYPGQTPPPPQPETNPGDYLDSIASQTQVKTMKPWMLWALIGGGLLIVIIFAMMLLGGGPKEDDKLKGFVWHVQALETLTKDDQKTIQSTNLRTINSSLTLILTNVDQGSTEPLTKAGVKKLSKAPKNSPITAEFTKLSSTLEDARLNAQFDRVYAREVSYQIAKLRAEIKSLLKSTNSKSLKAYLQTTDSDVAPLQTQFSNFNEEA